MSASDSPLLERTDGSPNTSKSSNRFTVNFKLHHILLILIIFAVVTTSQKAEMELVFEELDDAPANFETDIHQVMKAVSVLGKLFFTNQWNLLLVLGCVVSRLVFSDITLYIAIGRNEIKFGYKIRPFEVPSQVDFTDLDV